MRAPLALGPLAAEGFGVRRSGLRWLKPDGYVCRPGELIAQAEICLVRRGGSAQAPFAGERLLQVALAPPVGGRLRIEDRTSAGGWLDFLAVHNWNPEEVVASIETADEDSDCPTPLPLRRLMLAARAMTQVIDVQTGLLPGWNLHARAWWGEAAPPRTTLLSVGICDATGFVRGELGGFAELFEAASFPAHLVHATEHPIAPCAPILLEQLKRTPAELEEISDNLRRVLGKGPVAPTPDDYLFAGAFLAQMSSSPLLQTYDILGPQGLTRLPAAGVVMLSVAAEPGVMLRHRKLGYAIQVYGYNLSGEATAMRAWIERTFERITRSVDDVRRDLERLIDETHARTGARFIIVNRMSSSGREIVGNYATFEAPLDATLRTVRAKTLNLMLHDLAASRPVSILDLDALGAAFGGRHLPDGLHSSGPLQDALRQELLRLLEPRAQSTRNSIGMSAAPAA